MLFHPRPFESRRSEIVKVKRMLFRYVIQVFPPTWQPDWWPFSSPPADPFHHRQILLLSTNASSGGIWWFTFEKKLRARVFTCEDCKRTWLVDLDSGNKRRFFLFFFLFFFVFFSSLGTDCFLQLGYLLK